MDGIVTYWHTLIAFWRREPLLIVGSLVLLLIPILLVVLWSVPVSWALVAYLMILMLCWFPKWQVTHPGLIPKERFERENEARKTLAQIIGGAAFIAGLFLTWENMQVTQENATRSQEATTRSLDLTRQGQSTDRFTKAIAQLGDPDSLVVRLGGIYALERIAKDTEEYHWTIMEVLTAYIRENTQGPPNPSMRPVVCRPPRKEEPQPRPKAEIQAILTVIGQRVPQRTKIFGRGEEQRLNLANTDLRGADLRGAQLNRALLHDAQLDRTNLDDAHLEGAGLRRAHLEGAFLIRTHLEGADLRRACLEEAILQDAYLGSIARDRPGADLRGVSGLTVQQLARVNSLRGLYGVTLDQRFSNEIRQQHPQLLVEPRW